MPTITDVARLAGVSKTTVSRFLNKKGYISAQAKEKIEYAVKALNYKPSPIASGMVSRKTKTIGLLVPDITNAFFTQLARAVEDHAQQRGYTTMLCNSDNDPQKVDRYIRILEEKYVDGIIIAGKTSNDSITALIKKRLAFVVVDFMPENPHVHSIYLDNVYGGQMATNHLFACGCKRIAHIHGPKDSFSAEKRYQGYKQALQQHRIPLDCTLVQWGDYQIDGGYNAMKSLLALSDIPDGVFVANDMMVFGVLQAISESGLRVPKDIGIVGFDDIPLLKTARPAVTTVRQPVYDMGVRAVQILLDSINGSCQTTQNIILKPELIINESSLKR